MKPYRYIVANLDGRGFRRCREYPMSPHPDYWPAVTDVDCPVCERGLIFGYAPGNTPGYRACNTCFRVFMAHGTAEAPTLVRFRTWRDDHSRAR